MTAPQLHLFAALDRLGWGLDDCRQKLIQRGFWPTATRPLCTPAGERWALRDHCLHTRSDSRKAVGLLVPESLCLWGTLRFTDIPQRALNAAVQEALWRVSPLPPEQIVAAWQATPDTSDDAAGAQNGWQVQWGICRRSTCDEALARLHLQRPDAGAAPPIWLARGGHALPVRNAAWQAWNQRQRRLDTVTWVGLLLVAAALAAPALMPLALKRQAVILAVQHVGALQAQAAPLRQQLDELRTQTQVADDLHAAAEQALPLASVINQLSQVLPDDTWLDRIEINGSDIRIAGLTANAVDLIALLGRQPALADVRATSANVRDNNSGKERFAFAMRWQHEPKAEHNASVPGEELSGKLGAQLQEAQP